MIIKNVSCNYFCSLQTTTLNISHRNVMPDNYTNQGLNLAELFKTLAMKFLQKQCSDIGYEVFTKVKETNNETEQIFNAVDQTD